MSDHEYTKQLGKDKGLVKIQLIWDNGDGNMTVFSALSEDVSLTVKNKPIDYEWFDDICIYPIDTIESVTLNANLHQDDKGRYGKIKIEEIPEF